MGGGKLFTFDDVISPETWTEASMRKIFNFSNYESKNEWYTYPNLFKILKTAGYYTVWLSSQETSVFDETTAANYPKICDVYKFPEFLETSKIYNPGELKDEIILSWLDEQLPNIHEKNFYLLHLLGAHCSYNHRYTEIFNKFTPEDEFKGNGFDNETQREMRAAYDNATLYNDFIVDEIIKRFEDKNAIVIYVSDHGEEVGDVMDYFGHGILPWFSCSSGMLEIPFLIWMSEKCRAENPELEQKIAASVHRPYMTDDLIHTMLDILGIETEDYDPSRSVINEKFNASRPRRFQNAVYDKEKGLVAIQ